MVVRDELPLLMVRAAKAMVEEVAGAHPAATGLTAAHGIALRHVEATAGVTTVDVAAHLHITKQSASEIVAALERGGYVVRRPHPTDGRSRVIELTDGGRAGLVRSRARWEALVREWEALVGADALAVVRSSLDAYLDRRR